MAGFYLTFQLLIFEDKKDNDNVKHKTVKKQKTKQNILAKESITNYKAI